MLRYTPTTLALFAGIKDWMQGFAYTPHASVALFLFAFAESSFFPIPPDILLIALCLTDASLESLAVAAWFAAVCTAASTVGGAFGYFLGVKAGRPILKKLTTPERIEAVERLLQKYDVWAIAIAGFTPVPYKIFTIASGLLRVRFWRFMLVSVLSRGARFFIVATLCHFIGRPIAEILDEHTGWATAAFAALLVGGFLLVKWVASRYKDRAGNEAEAQRTR